ncbi:hypothetical protein GQ43DRAFT_443684 [Delitschia confertaspora ATCC 74209]|uniref:Uncharacterized protein n=1 Tax=Delitschia confertaspora ATCC 74209 TaxID=1513339 RepID=A0A9P4JEQ3_9PLEO|nr:hypothetical protein GQ43DRAFT_443684 [Delitschia confertaspora ATCC 74209]
MALAWILTTKTDLEPLMSDHGSFTYLLAIILDRNPHEIERELKELGNRWASFSNLKGAMCRFLISRAGNPTVKDDLLRWNAGDDIPG